MARYKLLFAFVLLALAAVAGLYLSGRLAIAFLGIEGHGADWSVYLQYLKTLDLPQVRPHAAKIRAAGYVGFGVPSLAYVAFVVLALRGPSKALHGDARFARGSDLARHGLFDDGPTSLVVGKHGGKLVRLPGQQFAILAAPTRSGKGVGIVIPNLLEYLDSVVVLDIKQENFDLTSGWRAEQGHDVYLFNPFAEDRRTHRWNPLTYVSKDPAFRVSDVQAIGAMLYPDGADDQKFWVSQGRNAFLAFTLYLFDKHDYETRCGFPGARAPTLGAVYRLSSGTGTDLRAYLRTLSEQAFLGEAAKLAFATLLSQADETFASIIGTFKEPLNPWVNPVLDAATSGDDFLLTDVRRKRMTIYVGIQPNKLAESRLIVNLFFSQLINLNTRELPQNNPALKHQCLLLMDEFTSIGRVEIIASAVAYMAGYNLRLLPIIQSMAQLDATYGRELARTLITNHALQILYAPREQQDANDYSEMLGYTTVRRHNVTRGREFSRSESEERRALMLPQELKAMGPDKEVVLYEGVAHPVMCEKIRYYKDPRYTARLRPKVAVPHLQV
ncbi:type IV secretory system conjugative DNA transfer family protein [Lysobacter humi (ex Lee et al. 2017)]